MFAGVLVFCLSSLTLGTLLVQDAVKYAEVKYAETPQEIAAARVARSSHKWCPPRRDSDTVAAARSGEV
jgi:hypothetical protein